MAKRGREGAGTASTQPLSGEGRAEAARKTDRIEVTVNGVRVEVSPELEAAVHRAYQGLVSPLPPEMTTTEAAEFLDVSRPFVVKLVQRRELPCRMVGKHRRIPSAALVEYREKMFQRARSAADEMAQTSQELGLYESEGPASLEQ
jgi:excisionase family DNA binding protein